MCFDAFAQPFSADLRVANPVQVDDYTYEFDVYIVRTSSGFAYRLNSYQFGLGIDTNILNGGNVTVQVVDNSSQLTNPAQQPYYIPDPANDTVYTNLNFGAAVYVFGGRPYRFINNTPQLPVIYFQASPISNINSGCLSPGTRISRFRLVNTRPFKSGARPNHIFSTQSAAGQSATLFTVSTNTIPSALIEPGGINPLNVVVWNSVPTCDPNITFNCVDSTIVNSTICAPNTALVGGQIFSTTGNYIIPLTGASGCDSLVFLNLVVNQPPSAGILNGNSTICAGASQTFTSTVSGGVWSSSNPLVATVDPATGLVSALTFGQTTLTYTVTGASGCANATASVLITVTASISAGTITGTQNLCAGTTATFSSTVSGGTWSSNNTGVVTVSPTTGLVLAVAAGTATITYTVLGSGGCADAIATRTVVVTNPPSAGILSGNQNLCVGGTTNLTSNSAGGLWSSSAVSVATVNATTGLVSALSAGTATISYTVTGSGGCPDATATRIITVTPPPSAGTLNGNQNLCSGTTAQFSSSVSGGSWSSSNTTVASVNATSGLVSALAAGTAIITYTVTGSGGCPDASATRTITVTAPPSAGVLSGNQNLCVGATASFSSTSTGGSWSSSNTTVATVNATSGLVSAQSAGTTTITYTVTGSGGCSDATATRTITVTAPPSAGTLSGNQNLCVGATANFSSTSTGGAWSSSNTTVATVNATSGLVSALSAGTAIISYTVTGSGGCPDAIATRTVNVTATLSAGILSGNQNLCSGTTAQFSSTISGGSWSSSNSSVAAVNATGLVSALAAGTATITYTVTGSGGCSDATATRTITVTTPPSAGTLNGNQNLCVGATANFSSTSLGGTWSSNNTLVASVNATTGLVSAVAAGTAIITYTVPGSGGCPDVTASRNVSVTANLSAGTLSGNQNLCSGASAQFSSTVSGGSWSSSNTSVATVNANTGLVSAQSAGTATITYTVTGSGGCPDATATLTVTVTPTLSAGTLSGNQNICVGSFATFTSTVNGGSWSSSNTAVATVNANTGQVTALAAGTATITYTVTGSGGCPDAIATRLISVTAPPDPGLLSGAQSLCVGGVSILTSSVSGGIWSSSNPAVATINPVNGSVTALSIGSVTMSYTVSGIGGCPSGVANIVLNISNTLSAGTLSGNQQICVNSTSTLTSTVLGGVWTSANPLVAQIGSSSGIVTGISQGSVLMTYTIAGSGGCPPASATRLITVIPSPVAGISSGGINSVCSGSSINLTASPVSGVTYTWLRNNILVTGQTASNLLVTQSGAYRVIVSSLNGCSDTSQVLNISVSSGISATIFDTLCFPATLQFGNVTLGASGVYRDTFTTVQGCDSIVTLNLFVDTVIAGLAPISSVCPGGNLVALTGGTPVGGQYFGPGITGNFFNPSTFTTDSTINYFYVYISPLTGCRDTAFSTIRILPQGSVTFVAPPAFCLNDTLTRLTGGQPAGGVYSGPGVVSGQFFNPQLAGFGSHLITYTINRQGGCSPISATALLFVNPLPVLNINSITPVCRPQAIDLTSPAITAGSSPGLLLTYWLDALATQPLSNPSAITTSGTYYIKGTSNATGCFNILPVNVFIRPSDTVIVDTTICAPSLVVVGGQQFAASGTYQVRLTNNFGCDSVVFLRLNVISNPVALINALGATAFCTGDSVVLRSNQGAGISVRWLYNGVPITGATNNTYTARDSGQYQAVVSFGGTCVDTSAILSVTVNTRPVATITASGSTTLCQGSTLQLTAGLVAAATYTWYRNGFVIPGQNTRFLLVSTSGSYFVRVENATCADFSDTINVVVNPRPVAGISASGSTNFCQGGSVQLNAAQFPGASIVWLLNGVPVPGATSPSFTATQGGAYRVVLSLGTCTDTSGTVTITVFPRPTSSITVIGDTSFCEGIYVRLAGPVVSGISYNWLKDGLPVVGQYGRIITVTTSGVYRLVLTNPLGCSDTSAPQVTIMRPRPAAPIISLNSRRDTLRSSVATGNQWFYNGLPITGATGQTLAIGANGLYFAIVIGPNGCPSDSSNVINITTVGIPEEDDFSIELYPNPTQGLTWLELELPGIANVEVELTTISGALVRRVLMENVQNQTKQPLDFSDLADGTYFLKVKSSNLTKTKKLILRK